MKHFMNEDQLVVVEDDFVDLQISPAVFLPRGSGIAETILEKGFEALSTSELASIRFTLEQINGGEDQP